MPDRADGLRDRQTDSNGTIILNAPFLWAGVKIRSTRCRGAGWSHADAVAGRVERDGGRMADWWHGAVTTTSRRCTEPWSSAGGCVVSGSAAAGNHPTGLKFCCIFEKKLSVSFWSTNLRAATNFSFQGQRSRSRSRSNRPSYMYIRFTHVETN